MKSIFFRGSAGRDWYRLSQRLLICGGNPVLWNKNEQSILHKVLLTFQGTFHPPARFITTPTKLEDCRLEDFWFLMKQRVKPKPTPNYYLDITVYTVYSVGPGTSLTINFGHSGIFQFFPMLFDF